MSPTKSLRIITDEPQSFPEWSGEEGDVIPRQSLHAKGLYGSIRKYQLGAVGNYRHSHSPRPLILGAHSNHVNQLDQWIVRRFKAVYSTQGYQRHN